MLESKAPHETAPTVVARNFILTQFVDRHLEESRGVFQLSMRGYTVPAFSFEKISPSSRRGPLAPIVTKQRGVIVQMLDRFVEARAKRTLKQDRGVTARRQDSPPG